MASTPTHPGPLDIAALRQRVSGAVLAPGDDGYDAARVVMLGGVDRCPAVIVRVAGTDDVREVVSLAREAGLGLTVRGGGHSGAGHSVIEGGIVVDTRDLTSLEIDVEGRLAWAGAGLTARAYTEAAAEHGLATGFGDTGSVGIAGITLGGGVGYLVRKQGLTIDNLLAAELVTADGAVHVVDAEHEPDLFWAVRGGGGNFGVATRFRYRLHAVDEVTGGLMVLPATPATVAAVVGVMDEAPDELSGIINVMRCPPMPFVPPDVHGRIVIMVGACYVGAASAAAAALAPLRGVAEPIADLIRPMRYPELYPPEPRGEPQIFLSRTGFLDAIEPAIALRALDRLAEPGSPMRLFQLRPLGGAAARVAVDATAYAHRDRRLMVYILSVATDLADRPNQEAWLDAVALGLDPVPGAYVNFLGDEGQERVRDAYPGSTWDRLAAIKRRYDPDNLFRHVQNVPPG